MFCRVIAQFLWYLFISGRYRFVADRHTVDKQPIDGMPIGPKARSCPMDQKLAIHTANVTGMAKGGRLQGLSATRLLN
jgi:hypothetical protein